MKLRKLHSLAFVLLAVLPSLGAQHRTQNFVVTAPTAAVAEKVAQYAEHYRKQKAIEWLGQEMAAWPQPCPLQVTVSMEPPSGATSFSFGGGRVQWQKMEIQGPLDRLLASVLPHEITHTVFAHHFGMPVPRWADEGGSVLSEDDLERRRHDKLVREILNSGKQIPLRRLMSLKEYPREVMCLYAQGFSMSDYLVKRGNKRTFLQFVGSGMQQGWDRAVQMHYGHRSVEELEEAWLKHLRDTRDNPGAVPVDLAKGGKETPGPKSPLTGRNVVRLTVPPVQPLDPPPVVRGAMPLPGEYGDNPGSPLPPPPPPPPTFYPSNPGWHPVYPQPTVVPVPMDRMPGPIPVRLSAPVQAP
jgi:hypothetical protein